MESRSTATADAVVDGLSVMSIAASETTVSAAGPAADERQVAVYPLSMQTDAALGEYKVFTSAGEGLPADQTPCMLCSFSVIDVESDRSQYDQYLKHLRNEHGVVVSDVRFITDLRGYVIHWKSRFRGSSVDRFFQKAGALFVSSMGAPADGCFYMSDALPEDARVRQLLHHEKLKRVLAQFGFERRDTGFDRHCVFCCSFFTGNRRWLFKHLKMAHGFNVGNVDNLVNVGSFLDAIERRTQNSECLQCGKVCGTFQSLLLHRQDHRHFSLDPKNRDFDQYYLINYLEYGMNWEDIRKSPSDLVEVDSWCDWVVDQPSEAPSGVCLFCEAVAPDKSGVHEHMLDAHGFDFAAVCRPHGFHERVQLVNFIRGRVADLAGAKDAVATVKCEIEDPAAWNREWSEAGGHFYAPVLPDDVLIWQAYDEPEEDTCSAVKKSEYSIASTLIGEHFDKGELAAAATTTGKELDAIMPFSPFVLQQREIFA